MLVEFKNNIKIFTLIKIKFIKHVLLSSMQMHAKLFQKYKVWSPTSVVLFTKEPSEYQGLALLMFGHKSHKQWVCDVIILSRWAIIWNSLTVAVS